MTEKKHDAEDDVELKDLSIEDDTSAEAPQDKITHGEVKSEQHEGLQSTRVPWVKRLFATKKRKVIASIVGVLLILGILYAVPTTRYGILGTVLKKNVSVVVTDSITNKPVTSATVLLGDKTVLTTEKGEADFTNVPVGDYTVKVTKKYYKDVSFSYTVPVFGSLKQASTSVVATGRQVSIKVVNTISKEVLAKASIVVGGTTAITDDKGLATVVLPADAKTLAGTISLNGYNDAKVAVTVTDQADKNNFSLTPTGTIFYLSNATGTLNVMKSNLDGTNAQIAVKGTGAEDARSTVLLASRDWKYLALQAHRTSDSTTQLYLLNAQTSALTLIDQGSDATSFNLVGWSNHRFIYTTYRSDVSDWQSGRQALKSYDAEAIKLTTIDQTAAGGTNAYNAASEQLVSPYIVGNKIIYAKPWSGNWQTYTTANPLKQSAAIMSINADGSQMTRLKDFPLNAASSSIEIKPYEPQSLYFRVTIGNGQASFFAYENGAIKTSDINDTTFYNSSYPTYLVSPSSDKLFWQEFRDGKNTLFVGDQNAGNPKTIASLSDYSTYGWFSQDYLLLSKNGSELYIVRADQPISDINQPVKITDYYKPQYSYPGYGYGYGGI